METPSVDVAKITTCYCMETKNRCFRCLTMLISCFKDAKKPFILATIAFLYVS